jgi:hypothetical protein
MFHIQCRECESSGCVRACNYKIYNCPSPLTPKIVLISFPRPLFGHNVSLNVEDTLGLAVRIRSCLLLLLQGFLVGVGELLVRVEMDLLGEALHADVADVGLLARVD